MPRNQTPGARPEGKIHHVPPWLRLVLAGGLTMAALFQSSPLLLGATGLVWCALYGAANLGWRVLLRDLSLVILQAPVVLLVYLWRQGLAGLEPACIISMRFALVLLPGLWLQRTTRLVDISQTLRRVLPPRTAFVMAVCLRFLPILARDAREIYALQQLRGARIAPRDLIRPWLWPEACHCLAVPLLMRMLRLADQIAVTAQQRGIDESRKETFANYGACSQTGTPPGQPAAPPTIDNPLSGKN
jgi:energy-coupling factor transport system permease protein